MRHLATTSDEKCGLAWEWVLGRKGARITDFVSLGVLAEKFPRTTIDRILQETGRASKRERNLPAHVVVYYVIALALYGQVSYGEVLRCLLEGLEWLGLNVRRLRGTAKSAITQARSRLGKEPLQRLYQEVVSPIATPQTQGAWYRGRPGDVGRQHAGSGRHRGQ